MRVLGLGAADCTGLVSDTDEACIVHLPAHCGWQGESCNYQLHSMWDAACSESGRPEVEMENRRKEAGESRRENDGGKYQ